MQEHTVNSDIIRSFLQFYLILTYMLTLRCHYVYSAQICNSLHISRRLPCRWINSVDSNYTLSQKKNIPDIFDYNLNKNHHILIFFRVNIPDTNCHHSVFYLTQCLLLHYLGKVDQMKCALKWMKKRP